MKIKKDGIVIFLQKQWRESYVNVEKSWDSSETKNLREYIVFWHRLDIPMLFLNVEPN